MIPTRYSKKLQVIDINALQKKSSMPEINYK
jgi:hypothetical protein